MLKYVYYNYTPFYITMQIGLLHVTVGWCLLHISLNLNNKDMNWSDNCVIAMSFALSRWLGGDSITPIHPRWFECLHLVFPVNKQLDMTYKSRFYEYLCFFRNPFFTNVSNRNNVWNRSSKSIIKIKSRSFRPYLGMKSNGLCHSLPSSYTLCGNDIYSLKRLRNRENWKVNWRFLTHIIMMKVSRIWKLQLE